MKKLILALAIGAVSTLSFANKPLPIQYGEPVPLNNGAPIAETYYKPLQPVRYKNEQEMNLSLFAEYSSYEADLDSGDTIKLDGFSLGVSSSPHTSGWYGKLEALKDDTLDADYYELAFGGQFNLYSYKGFYALGTLGFGYAWAESSLLANDVNFMTIPVGLEIGYSVVPELSLYAGIGYKWLLDTTSSTTCNNGTTSNSVGSGTCSSNGGIAYYNDYVGDNNGVTYKAGLRYNF